MRNALSDCLRHILLCCVVFAAFAPRAEPRPLPMKIPSTQIDRRVVASLPTLHGNDAEILKQLNLTGSFNTRTHWTFLVARLPGSHLDGASGASVEGGALAECFVNDAVPRCRYSMPRKGSSMAWFSTPVHFYVSKVVSSGKSHSEPLLLVKEGSAYGGDRGHLIFTELYAYNRADNIFKNVFYNTTGSNNNQETRFISHGPLGGDVIEAVPTSSPPYAYWVSVYDRSGNGGSFRLALRYRSVTRYGDGNRLAVIDSEMPNILKHFGKWVPGEPLPIPPHLPSGCARHLVLRHGEEWCAR